MQREQSCHLKCRIRGSKSKTTYFLSSSEMQWQRYQRKQNSLANEGTATMLRTNGRTANPAETRNSCTQKSWGAGFANYLQINYPTPHPLTARYCQATHPARGDASRDGVVRGDAGQPRSPSQGQAGRTASGTGRDGAERDGTGHSRMGHPTRQHRALVSSHPI